MTAWLSVALVGLLMCKVLLELVHATEHASRTSLNLLGCFALGDRHFRQHLYSLCAFSNFDKYLNHGH